MDFGFRGSSAGPPLACRVIGISQAVMVVNARVERRRERREVHIDRRKSGFDVIEHIVRGLRPADIRATSHDRPPRTRSRK